MRFTRIAAWRLKQTGWYPGRSYDTSAFEAEWKRHSMPVHTAALEFIKEFGGLSVKYCKRGHLGALAHVFSGGYRMHFVADGIEDGKRHAAFSDRAGDMCIIGYDMDILQIPLLVAMNEKGCVFGFWESRVNDSIAPEPLYYYGPTGDSAINNLCQGRWGIFTTELPKVIGPGRFDWEVYGGM